MGKLQEAKTLGEIGSILQLIPVLNIAGYVLVLIAAKNISDELQDKSIFENMLYAVLAGILGAAAGVGALVFGFFTSCFAFRGAAIGGILIFLVIIWISLIISAIFIRRAFDTMATRLNVASFKTAGLLYFIGALLTIVFFIGLIVVFVGEIFQVVAFFSISETTTVAAQPVSQAQPMEAMKFYPSCGTKLPMSTEYCPKCGARQPFPRG